MARLYEEANHVEEARAIYDALIAKHPHYADSYFRIGYMIKVRLFPTPPFSYNLILQFFSSSFLLD
jgi:hypothetical protein